MRNPGKTPTLRLLGSDAYEVALAGAYIPKALEIAKEAGITHVSTYKGRVATKHGI